MEKINFINNQQPAINDTNLNKLQDNVEDAIGDVQTDINNKLDKTSVKNTYSTSATDTYSCNYVNQIGKTAKINLDSAGQNFPQNTSITVNFNTIQYNQISNLTLDGNKIVIGAGIHTILLTARYACASGSYGKYIYISKEGYEGVLAFKMTKYDNTLETSMVIPVQEGEKYYITAYQENSSALSISNGISQSFMTVTVLG